MTIRNAHSNNTGYTFPSAVLANKSLSFYRQAEHCINTLNLPYRLDKETPSDGNCFYHALLENLRRKRWLLVRAKNKVPHQNDVIDVHILKSLIIQFMSQDILNNVCESCPNRCLNGKDHLEYLNENNVWADEFIVKSATALFGIRISLVEPNGQVKRYTWSENWDEEIYMFYFPKLHFQSLLTIHEYEKIQAKARMDDQLMNACFKSLLADYYAKQDGELAYGFGDIRNNQEIHNDYSRNRSAYDIKNHGKQYPSNNSSLIYFVLTKNHTLG